VFFESQETPYDLRWQMLGTHIRVSPWFWLSAVLIGWGRTDGLIQYLLVWVACMFVSILVHEFGHVLMGRVFGSQGHILLYSFGGLAIGSNNERRRWQRILVSLAGPGAGFVLAGLVFIIYLMIAAEPEGFREQPTFLVLALRYLLEMNIVWGLFNLMPVYPLDGGHVSRDICDGLVPGGQGLRIAFGISIAVAAVLAVVALLFHPPQIFIALMFGLLAFYSYQMLQRTPVNRSYLDDRVPWERDPDAWKRGGDRW
jgi:stage IV sporulation protein FB